MNQSPINQPNVLVPGLITGIADDYEPGSRSAEWSIDEVRLNRTYTNRLKVTTASRFVGPLQIIGATGLRLGVSYAFPLFSGPATENDTGSFLQSIKCDLDSEDGRQWKVTLTYEPYDVVHQLGNSDIGQGIINPTDRVPEVYMDKAKYQRSKPEDESSPPLPYVNTVGDPLIDTPETEETRPVFKIVRNESTYNDDYASQYKDAVNSDEFLGYPPNTVKCRDITAERDYDPDWGYYYHVTYEFEVRDDDDGNGFTRKILNAGYRQLVNGSGEPTNVVDATGNQVTDPVPLQKNGAYTPGADPYFLSFAQFPSIEFAGLNIPDDILTVNS